jgi:circadian clock protein KaiC
VFPRLADNGEPPSYELSPTRVGSGIQALDDMLGEGYWPGASTLLVGPTGVGKTLMGMHFVFQPAGQYEPAIVATMQEDPIQLERVVRRFGWSLTEDYITLMYRTPVDLYIDEWVHDLLSLIEATGARRVLVDSLGDLQAGSPDLMRFREYVYSLLRRCSRRGISLMMTYEVPELLGLTRLTEYGASQMADNVVLLQYRGLDAAASRTLTVLKTRASHHDPRAREFRITTEGILLAPNAT